MQEKIKVLVVDDSAFMRKVISDILDGGDSITVVGTARNGAEALEKIRELNPDVVTLDVEMPVMNGISCLKEIIRERFVPVVMISSLTKKGTQTTLAALEEGAVDFIAKPSNLFEMKNDEKKREIIDKIKSAKHAKDVKSLSKNSIQSRLKSDIVKSSHIKKYVVIGTSTGGPRALQEVITSIPGDVPAAFLVVQHMPPGFTRSLAERLDGLSELKVTEAADGDLVAPGHVYIAPGDHHMVFEITDLQQVKIRLSKAPPSGGHRPSVDTTMESFSDTGLKNVIAVIMTGMGGDGSNGIRKIKTVNNGYIIAQDEQSCVVYGMPKMAVQTGMVDKVVPLRQISTEILNNLGVHTYGDEPIS